MIDVTFSRTSTRVALAALLVTLCAAATSRAQGLLQEAKSVSCEFPLQATGTWTADGEARAEIGPKVLTVRFSDVDTLDGSAVLEGAPDDEIIVRLAGDYLHFMHTLPSGFLYTTTVFNRPARPGRFRAVHARHELVDSSEPVQPQQYYGDCEIAR
ncbi:MAG: hypothetical protein HY657_13580 [Acidobacteria bacterium]|nr:hypothetical protein [Acidobacteriota bacterium]